ncbi:MAG: carboxylating nicotinate-nucleotide diphosphorylase [Elusimicrobia bacterium]|nr:carboxylating nicotinate-nucleotide diphosphorylase [Elusimicrobiota bacterium]
MRLGEEGIIKRLVAAALDEDKAGRDVTSQILFGPRETTKGQIVHKGQEAVLCGLDFALGAFRAMDGGIKIKVLAREGERIKSMRTILHLEGRARAVLAAERTALNFLCHLSGIATKTREFTVALGARKSPVISDTRKTHPMLRAAEKYAVAVGGGSPHRRDLAEMAMVKDNHLAALRRLHWSWHDRLSEAARQLRERKISVEIEVQNFSELDAALWVNPDWIMLDNMAYAGLRRAVRHIRQKAPAVKIEVSGGVGLKDVKYLARLPIDRISAGAIVHSAPFANFSLELL